MAQSLSPEQLQKIDQYVEDRIGPEDPGMAIGIIRNGEVILEKYYGLASLQHQVPVTEKSRFNIASVAKQFTALMTLDLALQGKLDPDHDFREYLPGFYPEISTDIRIRHLLNHTSGIRDAYDLLSVEFKPWWRQEGLDNEDMIELIQNQRELNFEPGKEYLYSNSNYMLLAAIIEKISEQDFHSYSQTFFDSLGMSSTRFNENYMYVIPDIAFPYSDWGNGIWQQYPHMTNLYGDGFLYTTLSDQMRYEQKIQEAYTSENELFAKSQQAISGSEISNYGFGLELSDRLGYPAVHHSGSTGSSHAQVLRFPEEELSIVVMSNNGNTWSGFFADHIAGLLLPETEASESVERVKVSSLTPPEFLTGEYKSPKGTVIRIKNNEEGLYWKMDNNNPINLIQESENLYHWEWNQDIRISFFEEKNEAGFELYQSGSDPLIYTKMEPFEITPAYLQELAGSYVSPELDYTFRLYLNQDGELLYDAENRNRNYPVEIVQKDALVVMDYRIAVGRDSDSSVKELLLTTNRVRNVRFHREH